ncbi:MarR family winged helix-turn-helix transcriptional regulator [Eoetvoesiella caeni]|nr:MarR family transcriptional regulator [Eoetvoesiella caeni]MCI2811268.1 MarR family transcriptional regulator [Eoetvoesiella caeni]
MEQNRRKIPDRNQWHESFPEERLAHLLKDARRAMERALQIRLIEHSVAFGHWMFLRVLWEHDGLSLRQLSDLAGVSSPTAFSALKAMESQGYVHRERKNDNRKVLKIYLTEKGRQLKSYLVPLAEEVNAAAIDGLSMNEVLVARKVLITIAENLALYEKKISETTNRGVPSTRELGRLLLPE